MFILQSGKVKISKKIRGVEKTLATLEKGRVLRGNGDPERQAAFGIRRDDRGQRHARHRPKTFETLLRSNVEIAIRFIKRLADRLRETNEQMESLMIRDNTSRLVSIWPRR